MNAHQLATALRSRFQGRNSTVELSPIGIDFGIEKLNLVQFDRLGDSPRIRAAASVPYPIDRESTLQDPKSLRLMVNEAMLCRPFRGRKVVAAMPPNLVQLKVLNYRREPGEDEAATIIRTLRARSADEVSGAVIDYVPIYAVHENSPERAALVASAERDAVWKFTELLRKSKLDVHKLEVGPVAIRRLMARITQGDSGQQVVAINFGSVKSYVTVLWNGQLLLDREIDFGVQGVLEALSRSLEIPSADAEAILLRHGLAVAEQPDSKQDTEIATTVREILKPEFLRLSEEIKKVLVYIASATRGGGVETIYVLGGLARWSGADRLLGELSGLKISSINPFYGFDIDQAATAGLDDLGPIAGIAVATGLALGGY